ncbi:MAG: hypothetical protein HZC13_00395 [Nitrospirae bacterium]|nr:hypothetical protein [Nitrospirota bacterium]
MIPPSGDNSDALFKKILILSLLVYFIFALFIEMIPYTPKIIKGPLKPQRIVKLTEISVKEQKFTDEQKRRQEEKRLAEERKLLEERKKQEIEKQRLEEQKRSEEERRRSIEEQKRLEEERRLAEKQRRTEEQKRIEEEKHLSEEQRRIEEQKRQEEERQLAEERQRIEEEKRLAEKRQHIEDQKRLEEEKHAAEEQRRTEEQKRQEEKKRLTEEQQRMEEQKHQEEERRLTEKRQRIEDQKRLEEEKHVVEERRRIEEQKRLDEEKRLAEEHQRIEDQKRMEEEKRLAEERRRIEEQKHIEEERRLAKEKNREVARSSGLLKTMKGGKKPADNIIEDKEISSVLPAPADKLIQSPKGKTQPAGRQGQSPPQKTIPPPPSTKGEEKGLKGSEGIGDVSATLATRTPSSSLSGERGVTDIEIKQIDGGDGGGGSGTGGGDTSVVHPRRSQESIKEVVTTHRGSLDFIYKKALRNNPTLKGVVIIEFTIAANGDVTGSDTKCHPEGERPKDLKNIRSFPFTSFRVRMTGRKTFSAACYGRYDALMILSIPAKSLFTSIPEKTSSFSKSFLTCPA